MQATFHGGPVWEPATVARWQLAGRKRAAIAYLGIDGPDLLGLKQGDLLVVNAGPDALLAHATHPEALAEMLRRKVRVFTNPTLHAKVVVGPRRAVVGSANASTHSARLHEAVIVIEDKTVVADIRAWVTGLSKQSTEMRVDMLDSLRAIYAQGRNSGPPGTDATNPRPAFAPTQADRLAIWEPERAIVSQSVEVQLEKDLAQAKSRERGRGRYLWGVLPEYGHGRRSNFRRGDISLEVVDDGQTVMVGPPRVVYNDPTPVPGGRGWTSCVLVGDTALPALPAANLVAHVRSCQQPDPALRRARYVGSAAMRAALLSAWGLPGKTP